MKISKIFVFIFLLIWFTQNGFAGTDVEMEDISANGKAKNMTVAESDNQVDIASEKPEVKMDLKDANETQYLEENEKYDRQNVVFNEKVEQSIYEAWQQYCIAKNSRVANVRSEAYAKAIKDLNEAITFVEGRPYILLLGSRIYRGVGGISYAKQYFSKAAAVYLDDVLQNPESIKANLNAAIVLYAGDVKYWDTYNDSKKKAFMYTDKVLELYKNKKAEKDIPASEEFFLEEATALAFLIKGNVVRSNAHFAKAEKIWIRNDAKTNSSLIKILEPSDRDVSGEDYYKPYALFKEYPQQGKWLWPVTNQAEACKEFLLNCLTGF